MVFLLRHGQKLVVAQLYVAEADKNAVRHRAVPDLRVGKRPKSELVQIRLHVQQEPAPGDEIDLKQYIYESIVLSLPYQRVHPEGECNPEMLERFRIVSDSELAAVEARAGAQEHDGGEWAKLAALKERMEAQEPQEEDRTPEK